VEIQGVVPLDLALPTIARTWGYTLTRNK